MKSNIIERIDTFLTAFLLTDAVVIAYMGARGMETQGASLSSYLLYMATGLGVFRIVNDRRKWIPTLSVVAVLFLLMKYQYLIAPASTIDNYAPKFFMNGVGGFIIGYAVKDYYGLIKYAFVLSLIYTVLFFTEPVTLSALHLSPMQTGYILMPLAIWLFLAFFVMDMDNKWRKLILLIAIPFSIMIVLYASRGCSVSILFAVFVLIYYDNKKHNRSNKKFISKIVKYGTVMGGVFAVAVFLYSNAPSSNEDGSLIYKYVNGQASDSNGRTDIWDIGMELIRQHSMKGMGMGMDRLYIGPTENSFVHNVLLELGMNFGVPLMIVILVLYWTPIVKVLRKEPDIDKKSLVVCLCCCVWWRLMFSDTYLKNMVIIMIIEGVAMGILVNAKPSIKK